MCQWKVELYFINSGPQGPSNIDASSAYFVYPCQVLSILLSDFISHLYALVSAFIIY